MAKIRQRTVHAHPELGEVDVNELANELAQFAPILARLGGGLMVVSERLQDQSDPNEFYTTKVQIRWDSLRSAVVNAAPEPEPLPEFEPVLEDEVVSEPAA